MARYIDADLLLTDEKTHTLPNGCGNASGNVVVFVDDIEKLPTADVVPKSEVDLYKRQVDELEDELAQTYDKLETANGDVEVWKQNRFNLYQRLECYEMARQKVAREIFEEIEKYMVVFGDTSLSTYFRGIGWKTFAELKKKYTEGNNG